jgi:porphobilinogen synthase
MIAQFPQRRMRRNRQSYFSRQLLRETRISQHDLIYPVFINDKKNSKEEIPSMPGQFRLGESELYSVAEQCLELGISAVAVFPQINSDKKSIDGKEAFNQEGLVPGRISALKARYPELGIIADIALDPYTSHGQDGIINTKGEILNDQTVAALAKQALVCARAGADIVAPSDMMDGRVGALRSCLDKENFLNTQILSYSAKYASHLYGPFREAVGSAGCLKASSKESYQMDPANSLEALHEASLDLEEGADIIMIKPASYYMDIIYKLKQELKMPTFAYQVSGEYSMLKAASQNGWLDEKKTVLESLTCLKRAGCDAIISYYSLDVARWLR